MRETTKICQNHLITPINSNLGKKNENIGHSLKYGQMRKTKHCGFILSGVLKYQWALNYDIINK